MAKVQCYNSRNKCFVLISGGSVKTNQKLPFSDIPFDCEQSRKKAAEILAESGDLESGQPTPPPENGDTDQDMEAAPAEDESPGDENEYQWW